MKMLTFLKDWMLPIAMVMGVIIYFTYKAIPFTPSARSVIVGSISIIQPSLIASMLFLSFCKVKFTDLKITRWHIYLLLFQVGIFSLGALLLMFIPHNAYTILIEGAMLCIICPTATAAAVVVSKLEGSAASVVSYTIFINLAVSVAIPLGVSMIHPTAGVSFMSSFLLILQKVFPLLLGPLIAALAIRQFMPKLHAALIKYPNLPFYLWAVALSLAIAMTVKTIVHSNLSSVFHVGIATVSLLSCFIQFYLGRKIGRVYNDEITAGQALGQKNTILAIWLGYTFFTPVTAIAGGFYSVWHNLANSYQLYEQRKAKERQKRL